MSKDLEIHLYLLRNLAGDGFDNMVYHLDTGTRLKKTGAMQKLQTLDIDSRNRKVNISHNLEIYISQFKRSDYLHSFKCLPFSLDEDKSMQLNL